MSVYQICAILFMVILKQTGPTHLGKVILTWFFSPVKVLKPPKTLLTFHCYTLLLWFNCTKLNTINFIFFINQYFQKFRVIST